MILSMMIVSIDDSINEYFSQVGPSMQTNIGNTPLIPKKERQLPFMFRKTTEEIESDKNPTARTNPQGPDGVSNELLKLASNAIILPNGQTDQQML